MKEITRIINAKIICVEKVTDAELAAMPTKQEAEESFKRYIKKATRAASMRVEIEDHIAEC